MGLQKGNRKSHPLLAGPKQLLALRQYRRVVVEARKYTAWPVHPQRTSACVVLQHEQPQA